MDFNWKINGGHKQETREGYNLLDFNVTQDNKVTYNEDGSITINGVGAFSLKFNQITLEANKTYKQKMQLISGTIKDSSGKDMKDSAIMSFSSNVWLNTTKSSTYSKAEETSKSSTWVHQDAIFDNAKIKIWAYEGIEEKPYEQYGASPSPDYPSEIETVGSNINLFDKDNQDMFLKGLIPNNAGEIQAGTTDTNASKYLVTIIVPCLPNLTYIISRYAEGKTFFVYESSKKDLKVGDNVTFLKRNDNTGVINEKITTGANAKYLLVKIYNTFVTEQNTYNDLISSVKIEKGTVATPYSPYGMGSVKIDVLNNDNTKSQSVIMPIQQEMLENDYVADVEHHEWQKFIFDGVTNRLNQKTGTSANNLYYTSYISNLLAPTSNGVKIEICSNCFKSYTANQLYGQDLVGVAVTTGKSFSIGFGLESGIDTLDKANEKLKKLYDAGTPIIIYYKLAEAIDLELTSEQKAIRDTKLYTYKNITNIDVSDELASIDVTYKKDLETMFNNIIKQIPSSTSDTVET